MGEWRKLHNEELCVPYSASSIIRAIKSSRMIMVGHEAWKGEKEFVL
jgi:hypothetical protein